MLVDGGLWHGVRSLFEWATQAVSSLRTCEGASSSLHPMLEGQADAM